MLSSTNLGPKDQRAALPLECFKDVHVGGRPCPWPFRSCKVSKGTKQLGVVSVPLMDGWKHARRCNQGSAAWESKPVDDEQLHLLHEALQWALITLHSARSEYRRLSPSGDPHGMMESSELMAARRNLYIAMQAVGEIRQRISRRNQELGNCQKQLRTHNVVLH